METPQPVCMVRDTNGIRPLLEGELNRVTGFMLTGEGFGDMICMMPTIEKTARKMGRKLDVWTLRPEVFANIPILQPRLINDSILTPYLAEGRLLIACPVTFGKLPNRTQTHIVVQPAQGIIQLEDAEKEVRLYTSQADRETATRLLQPLGEVPKVVVHPNRSWPVRTWPVGKWQQLTQALLKLGLGVVAVGRDVPAVEVQVFKGVFDLGIDHDQFLNLTDRTSLHELCEVIALCEVVITVDSGVLHVANCTDTPIVAIFTDIDPNCRTRIRNGKPGAGTVVVKSACPMQYCQSWHGSTGTCIQDDAHRMCCLPSVDSVLNAAKGFLP